MFIALTRLTFGFLTRLSLTILSLMPLPILPSTAYPSNTQICSYYRDFEDCLGNYQICHFFYHLGVKLMTDVDFR